MLLDDQNAWISRTRGYESLGMDFINEMLSWKFLSKLP
jgi:hypothetical protein